MKHTFICNDDHNAETRIELSTDAVGLDDVLDIFDNYLHACGFVFNGNVTIMDEK